MNRRLQLRDLLDALAREYGPDCPFATCVLHALVGAMDTDIDREFATAALAWIQRELCITEDTLADMAKAVVVRGGMSSRPSPN